jgi:hypothetical protein
MVTLRNKTVKYYPFKVKRGFVIHKTNQPQNALGFATFRTKKRAIASGKRWYGKYKKPKSKSMLEW